jgi:hypothetical protein
VEEWGVALASAVLGVVGGFLAARYIDRLGARRVVYIASIGAVEVAGWHLRRRLIAIRDNPEARPRPPMPEPHTVNTPLGEMWIVAPSAMMAIVDRMQDHLREMEIVAEVPSTADREAITPLLLQFDDIRERLVNMARRQTGERALPGSTFRRY